MYDPAMVQPMRDELTNAGIKELYTPQDVDAILNDDTKTSLIFVNSVCGCAAGQARPGLLASLDNEVLPENMVTVFAGMEKEAVNQARSYFIGYPPSSPCLGVFRDGELVYFLQRTDFLNQPAHVLGKVLKSVYNKYCGSKVDESVQVPSFDEVNNIEVTVEKVASMLHNKEDFSFLDVREPSELNIASIPEATHLTQTLAEEIITKWPRDKKLVFVCHHGNRSKQAAHFFASHGFQDVLSMAGGIEAWADVIDSSIPKY